MASGIELDHVQVVSWIVDLGWYPLNGGKRFDECPQREYAVWDRVLREHKKKGKLHPVCDTCYKPKIIIEGNFDQKNLNALSEMLNSWEFPFLGKMNNKLALFYFRDKKEALEFTAFLKSEVPKYQIRGSVDWQKGCSAYWKARPELWKDGKEFIPPVEKPGLIKRLFSKR